MNQDDTFEEDMEMLDERIAQAFGHRPRNRRELGADDRVVVKIAEQNRPYVPVVELEGSLEDAMDTIERKLGIGPQRRRRI